MSSKLSESSSLLLSTSDPQIFLSYLMSSYPVIKLPLGLFFQQYVEFFPLIQNLKTKDMDGTIIS